MRIEYPPVQDENGVWVTPTAVYTYNAWGLLAEERDARGTVTYYTYTLGIPAEAYTGANPRFAPGVTPVPGLLTQVVRDDGGLNLTTTYKDFDAAGNAGTVIYPGNTNTFTYTYDGQGRVLSESNAGGATTTYQYDERGQLIRQMVDADGQAIVTQYAYDDQGRLLREWADGEGNTTTYRYDDADQLVNVIDADGNIIIAHCQWNPDRWSADEP